MVAAPKSKPSARILELGLVEYDRARSVQLQLVDKRVDGKIEDTFVFVEHPPTITVGRGSQDGNILATAETLQQKGVRVFEVERGGDVTFHGPGQQVIYPIIDLDRRGRDLHRFLRDLEQIVIDFLKNYDLRGDRVMGRTGVWVGDKKVCAIGVAVKRWISYHGLALNLDTDLSYFDLINPCGYSPGSVTSLQALIGSPTDRSRVFYELVGSIANVFKTEIRL
jgi:lipoic acid synthetase/lipoyl(octanoyl) transferase